jgi:ferredoxin
MRMNQTPKKPRIDKEKCIACGLCNAMVPNVFDWDDDGKMKAIVSAVPLGQEADVEDARINCPTEAILVEDEPSK